MRTDKTLEELCEEYYRDADRLDKRAGEIEKRPDAKEPLVAHRIDMLRAEATELRWTADHLIKYYKKD